MWSATLEVVGGTGGEAVEGPGPVEDELAALHAELLAQDVQQDQVARGTACDRVAAGVVGEILQVDLAGPDHEAVEPGKAREDFRQGDPQELAGHRLLQADRPARIEDALAVAFDQPRREHDHVRVVEGLQTRGVDRLGLAFDLLGVALYPGPRVRPAREDVPGHAVVRDRGRRGAPIGDDLPVVAPRGELARVLEGRLGRRLARVVEDDVEHERQPSSGAATRCSAARESRRGEAASLRGAAVGAGRESEHEAGTHGGLLQGLATRQAVPRRGIGSGAVRGARRSHGAVSPAEVRRTLTRA